MRIQRLVLLLAIASAAALAQSQAIYRCGADGRILQQHPCDTPTPPAGPSTASEQSEKAAAERVSRLQAAADRMESDRLAREARNLRANARAAGIDSRRQAADSGPAPASKKVKPGQFGAAEPIKRVGHRPAH
jgi:hypothetical protein